MKSNFIYLAALLIGSAIINPLFSQLQPTKGPDKSEYSSFGIRSAQAVGEFNELTPVYTRAYDSDGFDGTCQTTDGVYSGDFKYVKYTILANENEPLVLTLDATGDVFYCPADMLVYVYCDSFDPNNPETNYLAEDDDSGTGLNAAFLLSDDIQLEAGQYYDIVCTHWCDYTGEGLPQGFVLTIESNVTIQGQAPVETPISGWAAGIGFGLILVFTWMRFRRMQ